MPLRLVEQFPFDRTTLHVDVGPGRFSYTGDSADMVARHLYWTGLTRWERETWDEFIPRVQKARGFVDVGAFTGAYTLVACAANPAISCIAFEPVSSNFESLERNVALNGWDDRATTINAAVSSSVGSARFYLPAGDFPDTGHLETSSREERPGSWGSWVDVKTTTVAESLPPGFHIDLMKIDVEDAEGPVIRAMADTIAHHRPTLIVEMLASGSHDEATDVLDEIGYAYFHLTDDGAVPVGRPSPTEDDSFMNYLCVPLNARS